ncbi:MAG: CvpA family protein [Gammaproteobacteria bacterium]|nr:MAG: CvpA family protein [Gammaproteobacteria bacterium]RLA14397.1 MAG: CvpA family protein [Gammaproteobacteria bacterium]RLA17004.1 MAG: CvpA family protein [Gammaproteobacteria bacterium]
MILSLLDVAIIILVLVSTGVGWLRGALRELFSLVSWLVAGWVAYTFRGAAGELLQNWIPDPTLQQVVGGVVLFVATVLVLSLLGTLTALMVEKAGMRGADRSLGLVFGAVRGLVLAAGMVLLLGAAGFDQQLWWQNSLLVGPLEGPAGVIEQLIKTLVDQFNSTQPA